MLPLNVDHIGRKVVYRPPHVPRHQPGEEGVITSANTEFVFVRFGADTYSKACPPENLQLAIQEQDDR